MDSNQKAYELLEITHGKIYLDGKEVKNMTKFDMKADGNDCGLAEITITKTVTIRE